MSSLATVTTIRPAPADPVRHLARWAATACPPHGDVLNVGAGADLSGSLRPLLARRPRLVGVDPDVAIEDNPHLTEWHRTTIEDYAFDHPERFDVVISIFVLEHVEHPAEFARACAQVLRPGGSWFALTLNVHHYFGATTWALSRLHVAEPVLRRLKADQLVHEHHFPTVYRFNSRAKIRQHCGSAGFTDISFQCYDAPGRYQWYLPRLLRWFPPLYSRGAYAMRSPEAMGHLSFRATKPTAPVFVSATDAPSCR
jgi:SAM-dependent methyltransferase